MQQRLIAVKLNTKVIKKEIQMQTVTNLMMFNVQNLQNYMGLFFLLEIRPLKYRICLGIHGKFKIIGGSWSEFEYNKKDL